MLQNNLVNITNKDFVYELVAQRIGGHLPKDLQAIYNNCEHIQIIATDTYFLHYSLYPFLRNKNEDSVLEEARRFKQEYMADERYQRIKMLTTLDDEMSLIYSIALAKYIIGKVLGKLVGEVEYSQIINPSSAVKAMIARVVADLAEAGELGLILDSATDEAEEITKNANEIRELIGGKKAGKEAGTFKKVLDLAEHMMFVKFMRDIVTMSKRLSEYVPKASRILKRRGRYGDEISGYSLTKGIERALPREMALPDELFLKKLTGEGFLMKEKLSVAEGAYYILIDKCLDGDTLIRMGDGELVPIRDIEVGDVVKAVEFVKAKPKGKIWLGDKCYQFDVLKPTIKTSKVVRVVESGVREVLKIKTPVGCIRATDNHVIPTYRHGGGGRVLEVKARDLRPLDLIFVERDNEIWTEPVIDIKPDGFAEVYDITLENHNHFIANGIVVHNSGSMHGEKTVWARSVAMAIYRMAKTKRRRFFLRFFDTRVYPRGAPIQTPEEIVDAILKVKSNGGTDITNALSTALKDLIERGLSEFTNTIVIITDGEDVVQDMSKELRRANASLISVMIQGDNETLKALSDQYMKAELSELGGAKLLKIVEVS